MIRILICIAPYSSSKDDICQPPPQLVRSLRFLDDLDDALLGSAHAVGDLCMSLGTCVGYKSREV